MAFAAQRTGSANPLATNMARGGLPSLSTYHPMYLAIWPMEESLASPAFSSMMELLSQEYKAEQSNSYITDVEI